MSKKSSSGSLLSFVIRWPRTDPLLVCGRRRPGRSLRVALWSSRRRLWELARRSKNSSVFGDATDGAVMKGKKSESLKKKKKNTHSVPTPALWREWKRNTRMLSKPVSIYQRLYQISQMSMIFEPSATGNSFF